MKSQVTFTIEHGETTDGLQFAIDECVDAFNRYRDISSVTYEVEVDIDMEGQRELDPIFDKAFEPRSWKERAEVEVREQAARDRLFDTSSDF